MFRKLFYKLVGINSILLLCNCINETGSGAFLVTWNFSSGDCATNKIEKVHVKATSSDGDTLSGEAACSAPSINIGVAGNKTYTVIAQGIDANGVVRAENYTTTVSFSGNMSGSDIEVTLHPKASKVRVNWNGCPSGVVLPYFITLYNVPLQTGGSLVDEVSTTQMPCGTHYATLTNVPPGNYIVELDSRAITPKIYGTKSITVVAGEDIEVTFNLP
jgi:hypothetical protein